MLDTDIKRNREGSAGVTGPKSIFQVVDWLKDTVCFFEVPEVLSQMLKRIIDGE